jgi:methionine-rich copper-binding protein CopC
VNVSRNTLLRAIATATLFASGAAFAHPQLVSTAPSDGAKGPSPATIVLTFSEALMPPMSTATVTMTAMPGMTMGPMPMKVGVATASDNKALVITPLRPLPQGSYKVEWHVVAEDTHSAQGSLVFDVK